ncbi:hypothetical protein IKE84_00055 [Candidatus Saccharibacteria bacterium]|nr:hypothetical protein [Candidatus Saccharibacteria bacterium]
MIKDLIKLYENHNQLVLLEIVYFSISIISFSLAGIVALFNQSLGVSILIIPLIALIAGVMNVVAWSLIKLIIDALMSRNKAKKSAEKSAKKA